MGNCQAIDAAALVIQHPCGRLERLYWSIPASEVMRSNPGHYVSLIIPLPNSDEDDDPKKVRFTRVKLLRPTETLTLGHAYRLITSQEVMKVLRAKKSAKMKKHHQNLQMQQQEESSQMVVSFKVQDESHETAAGETSDTDKTDQEIRHERNRGRTAPLNSAPARTKSWRPTLQSIDEIAS